MVELLAKHINSVATGWSPISPNRFGVKTSLLLVVLRLWLLLQRWGAGKMDEEMKENIKSDKVIIKELVGV